MNYDNMKCYNVTCEDIDGNEYEVGVMTSDEFAAKHCAENSLLEGRHIKAKAIKVVETDSI